MEEKLKILILEDTPADANLMKEAVHLDNINFISRTVVTENDFQCELETFEPDVVLSDYKLPQYNGLDALEVVKKKRPHTPFIIVTGTLDEETAVNCMKFGAVDYVLKEQLVRLGPAVKKALELKKEKEQKELAEEALRESEEKYRMLVENANEAIVVLQNNRFQFFNSKTEEITGYSKQELLKRSFIDLIVPQMRDEIQKNHRLWMDGAIEVGVLQYRIIDNDGNIKWLGGKGVRIFWNNQPAMLAFISDITKRKEAEIALSESEQKFRAFFENAPEYCYIVTPDDRIIDINNSALKVLGYEKEEVVGESFFSMVFKNSNQKMATELFRECKTRGQIRNKEIDIVTRSGEKRSVLLSADIVVNADDEIVYSLFVQRDITDRKEAAALINEQGRFLELFFSYTLDCIIMMDQDFNYIRVNEAFAKACHRKKTEFPGKNHFDFFPSEPKDIFEMVVRTKKPCTAVARPIIFQKNKKRELSYWDWALVPILNANNDVDLLIFSMRDVTDRKKAEEKLKMSEERFRSLIFKIQAAVMVYDSNKKILMSNTIARDLLGIQRDTKTLERKMGAAWEFYREDGSILPEDEYPVNRVLKNQELLRDVILGVNNPAKKTIVWILVNADPVLDEAGYVKQIIVSFVDITERKKYEEKLRELNQELIRSNRELEEFTYVVSHDLKEPLRKMASFSEFLNSDYSGVIDEDGISYLNRIQDAADRMKDLIDNLLEISRIGTRKKELMVVDTRRLVEDVLRLLQFRDNGNFNKGSKRFDDTNNNTIILSRLPSVVADSTQLFQVFQNIISNGVKFHKPDTPAKIKIKAKKRGEWITFSIQDNGIGMEEQYLEKIFVIFQRLHTKDRYAGTGVGLALCKKIIERHNGKIWAESKIGEGSTFYFTLKKGISHEIKR